MRTCSGLSRARKGLAHGRAQAAPVEHDTSDDVLRPHLHEAADLKDIPHHPQHALPGGGPPPRDEEELTLRPYRLTDRVDDMRFMRSGEELVATGAWLYQDAAESY